VAALNRVMGDAIRAKKYEELAARILRHFVSRFWVKDHFAEYYNPQHGLIASHGLTDVDWASIALDVATPEQRAILWPQLKDERRVYYGGMPAGIATRPETYEDWEFSHPRRHDLAAMGRVWYLDAQARARMGDAEGLLAGIRRVCEEGRKNGFYWRERYQPDGKGGFVAAGPNTYCEYPANLIRVVQRFLLGVEFGLDGSLFLVPTVTEEFWQKGFGQALRWRDRILEYNMRFDRVTGTYEGGGSQKLGVRLPEKNAGAKVHVLINGRPSECSQESGLIFVMLPEASHQKPCRFEIIRIPNAGAKSAPSYASGERIWRLARILAIWGSDGEVGGGVLSGFPVIGEEVVEAVNGMGADALEDVAEVGEGADVQSFAGGDEAGEEGRISSSVWLLENTREPRPDGEAAMCPARHFGQTWA
jgi:hypothetical protein